ncbi:hypothetical protein ACFW1A_02875 [Kitasatospora sp. NPDC058965]|uniref:hypothetical protein n=1 Tax=Kitasatospora sp. NPDC058965 TaxID=3346682 RepID=UPI0036C388CC
MNTHTWYSQPFRADGGITADGLLGQLGRPQLSRLTILVREAAQNSWDARCHDQPVVRFRLDLSTVSAAHIGEWRRLFADGIPPEGDTDGAFRKLGQASSIRYLAVSDRGTRGLGGPTRSDAGHSTRREWLRFILNSGDRDGDHQPGTTGGTFGYGKGAFFLSSAAGCVFVHTRFRDEDGTLRSRFIGSAIRKAFWHDGASYTGRHWWGQPGPEHCEPLHDEMADGLARRLGLPVFGAEDTGTTVVIVDPDLTDPTLPDTESAAQMNINDAGTYLADAAAWNLWPIMLEGRQTRMEVSVTANGIEIEVPSPSTDPTLAFFADAYHKAAMGRGEVLSCGRPQKELGDFAYEYTYAATVTSPAARDLGIEGAPHHVCLIRGPELVTRYYEGPERPNPHVGYAGVFKVSDELDPVFARSEPPTHDAWAYQQLKGQEATFVRTLGRRLKERCDAISGATAMRAFKVGDYRVGSVAQRLGHLLAGPGGTGTAVPDLAPMPGRSIEQDHGPSEAPASGTQQEPFSAGQPWDGTHPGNAAGIPDPRTAPAQPQPRTSATRRPTLVSSPRFEFIDGKPVLVQRVRLHGSGRNEGHVKVVTGEGGTEHSAPLGTVQPTVYGWRTTDGRIVPGEVLYHSEGLAEVDLIVVAVPDAVLELNVTGQQ